MSDSKEETNCEIHNLPFKLYCEDCLYLICNKCNRQFHEGHEVVKPSEQERTKALLEKRIPNNKDQMRDMLSSLQSTMEKEKERTAKLRERIAAREKELKNLMGE